MRPRYLSLLALAACRPAVEASEARLPNVVVIVIDTLRADHLGAYGYPRPTSPTIDRLAAEGVLFEDVTSQCSWTLPSIVSMFQGRYLTSYRDVYLDDAPTLAEVFRAAGYRTVGVVGNGLLSTEAGFDRGFDHYDARKTARAGARTSAARRADELFAAAVGPLTAALAAQDGQPPAPLFAYLHFMDPHGPYANHDAYAGELPLAPGASGVDLSRQRAQFEAAFPGRARQPESVEAWADMARELARYDQEVRYADEYVERLIGFLQEQGALADTLLAIVADHGEGLYDHRTPPGPDLPPHPTPQRFFFREHGKLLYEELIGTPMILWGRGVPVGLRVAPPVENVDLFPTLLELARLEAPEGLHGRSLVPTFEGETLAERPQFSAVLEESAVRDPRGAWKLIVPTELGAQRDVRLFDLREDPRELENLAEARPEAVAELARTLEEWVREHPTETSLGRQKSRQTKDDLRELGYVDEEE